MGTSSLELENQALKVEIAKLQTQLAILQDQEFMRKLNWAWIAFNAISPAERIVEPISWAPGAGRDLISIAEDFDAPLEDFAEYM